MNIINIGKDKIKLLLTSQQSSVRIADKNGNHTSKPTKAKNLASNYVEWMIRNAEIQELINNYLNIEDKKKLAARLKVVKFFLNKSEYATREAKKTTLLGKFKNFKIYKYEESFFSFERTLSLNIRIRITFKMGDFTLAPHMFILLPFDKNVIKLLNYEGPISDKEILGSGCYAIWEPGSEVICATVEALSHASESHKKDLLAMLE